MEEGLDDVEAKAAYRQKLLTGVLEVYAQRHSDQLPALQKLTSNSFAPGVWESLDEQTKRMLLSAELYGSQQAENLDHSGPLLGLCAACERELNLRLYAPARAMFSTELGGNGQPVIPEHPTLGTGQFILQKAIRILKARSKGDGEAEAAVLAGAADDDARRFWALVADYLGQLKIDPTKLKGLSDQVMKLNMGFRRLAAHDEAIEPDVWAGGRDAIFGRDRVLTVLAQTLPRPEATPPDG